mmetsp:Transcript_7352/g.21718  ORF Transcript_7352/g.21718 Transcript_7352/m.21718 type:complete len:206 (-) Transcript_7352:466-1083(-)
MSYESRRKSIRSLGSDMNGITSSHIRRSTFLKMSLGRCNFKKASQHCEYAFVYAAGDRSGCSGLISPSPGPANRFGSPGCSGPEHPANDCRMWYTLPARARWSSGDAEAAALVHTDVSTLYVCRRMSSNTTYPSRKASISSDLSSSAPPATTDVRIRCSSELGNFHLGADCAAAVLARRSRRMLRHGNASAPGSPFSTTCSSTTR